MGPEGDITPENIDKCRVEVDGTGGNTYIRPHELTYDLWVQLTSENEAQVREALDSILVYRKFYANDLESILKSNLKSDSK